MPQSLSVRNENLAIATLQNLIKSDKIHKSDVNKLNKMLNSVDTVVNSKEFMSKMRDILKDPEAFKNIFCELFSKLNGQNSKMLNEKWEKLENIQNKLMPVVKNIHTAEINGKLSDLSSDLKFNSMDINTLENEITANQKSNATLNNQIGRLEKQLEPLYVTLNTTTEAAFIAADEKRIEKAEAKIETLSCKFNLDIEKNIGKIKELKNIRHQLVDFAKKHNVAGVESDLKRAESGAIFNNQDMGFGTTSWKEHMSSEKYAKTKFGTVEKLGSHSYSPSKTEPNAAGKNWLKMMEKNNKAPGEIKILNREIHNLKKNHESEVRQINFDSSTPKKEIITQSIKAIKDDLSFLKGQKESNLDKISTCQHKISSLEATKKDLETQRSLLEAKLN